MVWLATVVAAAVLAAAAAFIRPSSLAFAKAEGRPSFDERFQDFDHGVDQVRPSEPHRWRTVYGYGGPSSSSNRVMSSTSFAADASFHGIVPADGGKRPPGVDPFRHRPGLLTIAADKTPPALRSVAWNKPYYGGVITTKFSFSQRFGYFEIEARLPVGKGVWPAFWLMPTGGTWPADGEIDVFEGLGDPNFVYCTVIAGSAKRTTKVPLAFDPSAGFHRYGVLWGPTDIVWYIDRKVVARAATPAVLTRRPAYMIANLAIGGSWGGYPDGSTRFPALYDIRRITAWPYHQKPVR